MSLCDHSGAWSNPFKQAGYKVIRVDLEATGEDVRLFEVPESVFGILAAPPCTHFARSGAVHWKIKGESLLLEGLSVVDAICRLIVATNPQFYAIENPLGRLDKWLGKPDFYFQPFWYGDGYSKRTCLWGKFNRPPPTEIVEPIPTASTGVHSFDVYWRQNGNQLGRGANRTRRRSITPGGFSRAFAAVNGVPELLTKTNGNKTSLAN